MKELGKITFPTDVERGLCHLVNSFLLCSAALSRWDPTLFEISGNLVIGSGLDMDRFIVIVLTGTVQPLVLCVPHGVQSYLLGSHCWLTDICQVRRNKVICGNQSLLPNVWLGSPAGSCQGLSALQCMVSETRQVPGQKFILQSMSNGPHSIHWIPAGVPTLAISTISHKESVHSGIPLFFFLLLVLFLLLLTRLMVTLVCI